MKVGINEVKDILLGETPIVKVYRGEDVIWERGGLPSGYRQVEYLESTGTQYIDSGVKLNNVYFKIFVKYEKTDISRVDGICGTKNNSSFGLYFYAGDKLPFGGRDGKIACAYGSNNVYLSNTDYSSGQNEVTLEFTQNGFYAYANNSLIYRGTYSQMDTTLNYFIFGCNTDGVFDTTRNAQIKLYSFKMYDSNGMTRDFIPCLDPNQRPCMFDLVTKQPFYNQGTGEFLYE